MHGKQRRGESSLGLVRFSKRRTRDRPRDDVAKIPSLIEISRWPSAGADYDIPERLLPPRVNLPLIANAARVGIKCNARVYLQIRIEFDISASLHVYVRTLAICSFYTGSIRYTRKY